MRRRRGMGAGATAEQVMSLPWYCYVPGVATMAYDKCNLFGNQAASFPTPAAPPAPPQSIWKTAPADEIVASQTVQDVSNAQIAATQGGFQMAVDTVGSGDGSSPATGVPSWIWIALAAVGGLILARGWK